MFNVTLSNKAKNGSSKRCDKSWRGISSKNVVYKTVKIMTKEDGTIDENKRMMLLIKEMMRNNLKM